jgi:hypothetical protein
MNDDRYEESIHETLRALGDRAPLGPDWHELGTRQLVAAPPKRSALLVVVGAMAAALVVVGSGLVLLNPTEPESADKPVVSSTTSTPTTITESIPPPAVETPAGPPRLEVDAPEGEYVITHLRAVVSGRVDPGTEVTVAGVLIPLDDPGNGRTLSATFEHEFWLELGENFVPVTAKGPGGNTTWTLRPIVLPSARTRIGFISGVTADGIDFDPAEIVDSADPARFVRPPTLTLLGAGTNDLVAYNISNPSVDVETHQLDPAVGVLLGAAGDIGPVDTVVPLARWKGMWTGEVDDSDYYHAATPAIPYWVTTHNGVVVQIQQFTGDLVWGSTAGPIFGEPAEVVLVFDDGIDGVLAVDPDSRVGSRSVIDGQSAGDQPYRLTRVDDHFVVSWGGIFASNIATRESVSIGAATIYVPAVEPGLVWMIDYPSGSIQGSPEVWLANMAGDRITEPVRLSVTGFPAIGIPGGLAVETDSGVALWDAATGEVRQRLGSGSGFVSDAKGPLLAWCDTCTEVHITNVETGEDVVVPALPGGGAFQTYAFGARSARFSPDGQYLATLVAENSVVLIGTATGEARVIANLPATYDYFGWSADSRQLYASSYSYSRSDTTVLRYDLDSGETDLATLPFGGALSFVVLTPEEARPYLDAEEQLPADCPPVFAQPSGRTGICGFRF